MRVNLIYAYLFSLISNFFLLSDPLPNADLISVTYSDSSWGSGYQAAIILTNKNTVALQNWTITFTIPGQISTFWNAVKISNTNNTYTFGAPTWQTSLEPGASTEIGFVAVGAAVAPTTYTLGGNWAGKPGPIPTPTPTPTPTPSPVPAPVGNPAKPNVSVQPIWNDPQGSYDVIWSIWYGIKGTSWQLYENDKLIYSANLTPAGLNTTQTASYRIGNHTFGVYKYKVVVINQSGSTTSDEIVYLAGGASKIVISPDDASQQQLQLTVSQGPNSYDLSMIGVNSPSFSVSTNNPTIVTPTVLGNKLKIVALKEGRASLRIKENNSGEVRYIGIRVKTSDNKLPGLPNYVALGTESENTPSDLTFLKNFGDGLLNKRVDIRYIYINGGPYIGWRTWSNVDGGRAIDYIKDSKRLGIIPFFVYYNIPDGGESYFTDKQHIEDSNYMQAYFKDLKFFLDIVRNYGGDELVGIILEPDFIGYMMQNSNGNNPTPASLLFAHTDSAYTSGVLDKKNDPTFANNIRGLVQCINYIISKYAPNAKFGWQFNLWASPGITTEIPGTGLMRITDTKGITKGRTALVNEAQAIANYYMDAGVTSYGAQFLSIDKYGLDAGISNPQNPAQSTWFWNADHWNNYLLFAKTLNSTVKLPVILWQLPVGHINSSLEVDPYLNNGLFPALNNTSAHYEDSTPDFFLGDSFVPGSQTRLSYFATNNGADPKITAKDSTVTWQGHMQEAKNSGVIAALFGPGVGDSTKNIGNPPTDSYWWITKAQKYYTNPVPLS